MLSINKCGQEKCWGGRRSNRQTWHKNKKYTLAMNKFRLENWRKFSAIKGTKSCNRLAQGAAGGKKVTGSKLKGKRKSWREREHLPRSHSETVALVLQSSHVLGVWDLLVMPWHHPGPWAPWYWGTCMGTWSDVPTRTCPPLLNHLPQRLTWHFLPDISFSLTTGSKNTLSTSQQFQLLPFWAHFNDISVKWWWVWQLTSRLRYQDVSSKRGSSEKPPSLVYSMSLTCRGTGSVSFYSHLSHGLEHLSSPYIRGLMKTDFWTVECFLSLEKVQGKSNNKYILQWSQTFFFKNQEWTKHPTKMSRVKWNIYGFFCFKNWH